MRRSASFRYQRDTQPVLQIVREYRAQYTDPIDAASGTILHVGRQDAEMPGWWWCTAPDDRSGWVPQELLDRTIGGARAALLRAYTARELTVERGETVAVEDERRGWIFVRNAAGASGWVPATH